MRLLIAASVVALASLAAAADRPAALVLEPPGGITLVPAPAGHALADGTARRVAARQRAQRPVIVRVGVPANLFVGFADASATAWRRGD